MRYATIYVHGVKAGILQEQSPGKTYIFQYDSDYTGPSVSMTLPRTQQRHEFDTFPPFFEGLLPEGDMLEGLLRQYKIDRRDCFSQLIAVGGDTVGAVTITEATL